MGHHVGAPDGHSLHGGSYCVHVGDSCGFILNNVGSAHCSHHRFSHHLWLYGFYRGSDGRCGWSISLQAGHNSLKARRWGNLWSRLGGPWWWCWVRLLLCGSPTFFGPLAPGPPSPYTLAVLSTCQLTGSWGGLPHGCHWLGGIQHLCPTRELALLTLSFISPLTLHQRGGDPLPVQCPWPSAWPAPSWASW